MWLLMHSTFLLMEQAHKQGFVPSAEQSAQFQAKQGITSSTDKVGVINVTGVLTQEPDMFAEFFGGGNTTYSDIINALHEMNADSSISSIQMHFDTPGGQVAGMFQAMDAIAASSKPVTGIVGNIAASAGYGLVSQTNTIVASHRSSRVGSIGVAASFFVSDNLIDVASSNAPNKRPDVATDEGKAIVQQELDQMANLLDEGIAAGRSTTVKDINANFGKGGMLLASDALSVGMIDSIKASSTSASSIQQEAHVMDLIQLKAEHPTVYAEAVAEGVTTEKKRVSAHLSSGEACGDMSIATAAISEGKEYGDSEVAAAYFNAGLKKNHIDDNVADDDESASAADGSTVDPAASADDKNTQEDVVLAGVEAAFGTSIEGGDKQWLIR